MRVPLNSIKKLTDITTPIKELTEKVFTQIGAVEEIEDLGKKYDGILVAKVHDKSDHPDSEKLGVYRLEIGNGQTVQVVAGDKTLDVGDLVAYFTPGTKLPYNAKPGVRSDVVEKVTLRGVESEGMMAAQKELDLGNDYEFVMRLDKDLIPGTSFALAYGLNDTVLDIENKALANRADCFGLIGVARELAAIQGIKFESPKWYSDPKSNKPKEASTYTVEVGNQTQNNCPRYMCVVIDNVEVGKSPIWLQVELAKAGIKSINNVVDVTNYLMVLTAQPLHAFDYDKVVSKDTNAKGEAKIIVRQAQNGEKIHALNDKVLELDDTMAVICDSTHPIAVAGIIGGKDTEIDENTTKVILEVANFNRYNIRKTSWKLGVFTDAVTRFTKAQDPKQCEPVLYEAIRMLGELAGGEIASTVVDNYPNPSEQVVLKLEVEKLNTFSGLKLSEQEVVDILENIEYKVTAKDGVLEVTVPTFRQDVNIVEDIYEDVARIYGFNSIEVTLPNKSITPAPNNTLLELKYKVRNVLSGLGANEVLTYNFVGNTMITNYLLDIENAYQLRNPLSPELEFMRINLIPSLCEKLKENINRGYTDLALYEINIGHNKLEKDGENLPIERWVLSMIVNENNVNGSSYYVAKAYLDQISKKLNLKDLQFDLLSDVKVDDLPTWLQLITNQYNVNRSAVVSFDQEGKKYFLGLLGEYSNNLVKKNSLPASLSGFEIDMHALQSALSAKSRYQEPSRFPKISQDLCFALNMNIQYLAVKNEIEAILKETKMYYELEPVDIYSSEKTPDIKQMTFRVSLQSRDKTLEGSEYNKVKDTIIQRIAEKFEAKLV